MKHKEEPMSDYKNRMKEWITNMVREELTEDDSWWTSMSADQQADYIKQHPQSQKAQDAKKEKEDDEPKSEPKKLSSDEIDKKIKDLGDKIRNIYQSGMSPQDSERYIAGIQKQIDDLKSQKGDDKDSTLNVDSAKAQEIEDWYDNNKDKITDEADREELSDMIRGLSVTEYDLEVANNEGDNEEAEYLQNQIEDYKDDIKGLISKYDTKPKTQSQPKQKVAGAADSREVRNNVMNRLGRDQFNKMSYGELQQAYDDEFERLGWKKDGKSWVKQESVEETKKRDYKAEYKKFQSSTKAKKYRAELNKYNRQKGTYGNGDGKDASHKGGKIVGFEAQSKNRGRAEKSRLKKESLKENLMSFYKYMGDFYGKKGIYPDKKGRDLKVGDINKALSVYLKKYAKDQFTGDSLDRERVRDILIKMKKIDPQYKKQEVKENKEKIKKYLMSKGDNEKDATDKLRFYDLVKKLYKGAKPAQQAQIMSSLWANEGIKEGKMRPAVKKLLKQKGYAPIFQAIDNSKRQFKQMRYSRGEIQDTLFDMFGSEDPKIVKKIKESINEEKYFDSKSKFKKYMDKVFKQAKIKVMKFKPMKQSFHNGAWGGFYHVKSGRGTDTIPVYISRVGEIELGISAGGFHPGKVGSSRVVKNLKDFRKGDLDESVNEDVYAIVDKFNQRKQDYDQVYFKDNNLNKVKKHMKKMGKKYGKMNLIRVKTNGKMSLVEGVSKSQAQEIMRQLGGRKFEMLMGVKSKGVGKDGLIIHIGRNPKKISHIIIDIDRGKDLYNLTFGKIFKYQFKVVKKLKGIYVDQLHDMIEKYTGLLTTFRKR